MTERTKIRKKKKPLKKEKSTTVEANETFNKHLIDRNHQALIDYNKLGSFAQLAIPTPDHYFPLIYSLGLSDEKDEITIFNNELVAGSLNMTSVRFG